MELRSYYLALLLNCAYGERLWRALWLAPMASAYGVRYGLRHRQKTALPQLIARNYVFIYVFASLLRSNYSPNKKIEKNNVYNILLI